jgi:hypothetical protein
VGEVLACCIEVQTEFFFGKRIYVQALFSGFLIEFAESHSWTCYEHAVIHSMIEHLAQWTDEIADAVPGESRFILGSNHIADVLPGNVVKPLHAECRFQMQSQVVGILLPGARL